MTDTAPAIDQAALADLTRRYLDADHKRQQYADECDRIKTQIRALLPAGTKTKTPDGISVSVTPTRRFDAEKAVAILPAELLTHLYVSKLDTSRAKQVIPPALFEQCLSDFGDPRVSIR